LSNCVRVKRTDRQTDRHRWKHNLLVCGN